MTNHFDTHSQYPGSMWLVYIYGTYIYHKINEHVGFIQTMVTWILHGYEIHGAAPRRRCQSGQAEDCCEELRSELSAAQVEWSIFCGSVTCEDNNNNNSSSNNNNNNSSSNNNNNNNLLGWFMMIVLGNENTFVPVCGFFACPLLEIHIEQSVGWEGVEMQKLPFIRIKL